MADQQIALRKRQQIAQSGRTMFIWVAIMAAIVGVCAVIAYSLWQRLSFETGLVSQKDKTISVLKGDNNAVDGLKQNIQKLSVDTNLGRLKINDGEDPLQVVLDALPADANSLALGSSLQDSLLASVSGVTVNTLTVNPVGDEVSSDGSSSSGSTSASVGDNTISFHLVVSSSDPDSLKQLLGKFESSIRIVDIDTLDIERSDTGYTMTVDAHAYYEPAQQFSLTNATYPIMKGKK